MPDLIVDPQIRTWVFVPIVIISFLIGLLKHYISLLLISDNIKKPLPTAEKQRANCLLIRSQLLRENGGYLPKSSYLTRKQYIMNCCSTMKDHFKVDTTVMGPVNQIFSDQNLMQGLVKNTLCNSVPMFVVGGWIMYTFSGFILTKVPFPLSNSFKEMLQREIELENLEVSWVSSASWYFLNIFGLRGIYDLILGEQNYADNVEYNSEYQYATDLPPTEDDNIYGREYENLVFHKYESCLEDEKYD